MQQILSSRRSAALVLAAVLASVLAVHDARGVAPARPGTGSTPGGAVITARIAEQPAAFAISEPLAQLAGQAPRRTFPPGTRRRDMMHESILGQLGRLGGPADPVVQRAFGGGVIPGPSVSFDGIPQTLEPLRPLPPDTVGEIGPDHYVQMVNLRYAVFDRAGRVLVPPTDLSSLWEPLGGVCGILDRGDPIVVYDQLADRWVLSQFGFLESAGSTPLGPFYECIAVSRTGDPTGEYYLYAFKVSDVALNDYPKLGVWPDAYYLAFNEFAYGADGSGWFDGAAAVAVERDRMLAGDPGARMLSVDLPFTDEVRMSLLPSDLDGERLPPAGAPNTYVQLGVSTSAGWKPELRLYRFHVEWGETPSATWSGPVVLPTAAYDPYLCDFDPCVPQKGTFARLDALSDRLMNRLAYRNLGDHESLVVNHTVDAGGDRAGVRWYEIRNPRTPVLYQQGTFAPGGDHRWMGSVAMDGNGNLGLGYSVSGTDLYPSVRYTGRLAGDPAGELTLGEGSIVEGSGAQTHPAARWGDYSSLTVDPLDDCTFWYTQEYYAEVSVRGWRTRIGAFQVDPSCDATAPNAKARSAKAVAGKNVRLRYTTADNKSETGEEITIYRASGKRLKTYATKLGPAGPGSISVRAPRPAGVYRWCVVAFDGKDNRSTESCAKLTVR